MYFTLSVSRKICLPDFRTWDFMQRRLVVSDRHSVLSAPSSSVMLRFDAWRWDWNVVPKRL